MKAQYKGGKVPVSPVKLSRSTPHKKPFGKSAWSTTYCTFLSLTFETIFSNEGEAENASTVYTDGTYAENT